MLEAAVVHTHILFYHYNMIYIYYTTGSNHQMFFNIYTYIIKLM